jgi:hypothetical protein
VFDLGEWNIVFIIIIIIIILIEVCGNIELGIRAAKYATAQAGFLRFGAKRQ